MNILSGFRSASAGIPHARPGSASGRELPGAPNLFRTAHGDTMRNYADEAMGLIETLGMVPAIYGADAMLKAADVQLFSYENVGPPW